MSDIMFDGMTKVKLVFTVQASPGRFVMDADFDCEMRHVPRVGEMVMIDPPSREFMGVVYDIHWAVFSGTPGLLDQALVYVWKGHEHLPGDDGG